MSCGKAFERQKSKHLVVFLTVSVITILLLGGKYIAENFHNFSVEINENKTNLSSRCMEAKSELQQRTHSEAQLNVTSRIIKHQNNNKDVRLSTNNCLQMESLMNFKKYERTHPAVCEIHSNESTPSSTTKKSLQKRAFLIFRGGGVLKLVIGVSIPVQLVAKDRSMSYYFNLQFQYNQPTDPIYWWTFTNTSTFEARRHRHSNRDTSTYAKPTKLPIDPSRSFLYKAIERLFDNHGLPGEACLLLAICDIARVPFHIGRDGEQPEQIHSSGSSRKIRHDLIGGGSAVFHALLNAIFIPQLPNVAAKYLKAHRMGIGGYNCRKLYNGCPRKGYIWEQVSMIQ